MKLGGKLRLGLEFFYSKTKHLKYLCCSVILFKIYEKDKLKGIKSDHTQTFRFQCFSMIAKNVKSRTSQNVYLGLHQNGLSVETDDREAGGHGEEVDCHAALVFIGLTFFQ